jgi:hypothetical protein
VFLAGRAGVAGDRRGFSRSSHNGRVYTDCLTIGVQRTQPARVAVSWNDSVRRVSHFKLELVLDK